jgi:hypothetical protein
MWIRLHIFVRIIEVGEHCTFQSRSYIFFCRMEPFSNNTLKTSESNPKIVRPLNWETQTIDPGFNSNRTVSVWRKSQRRSSSYASQVFFNIVPINLYLEARFMWCSGREESSADAIKFLLLVWKRRMWARHWNECHVYMYVDSSCIPPKF